MEVNGINAVTGGYLPGPPTFEEIAEKSADLVLHPREQRNRQVVAKEKIHSVSRMPTYGVDVRDLASAGWGVVFGPDVDRDVREALKPLLDRRRAAAGALYKETDVGAGVDRDSFLGSFGVGYGPVDPRKLPYYLLLVGDPRTLPFDFQYELDMQYAVGRLHFETAEEYGFYAKGVLAAERSGFKRPKALTFFATEHSGDGGSRWLCRKLVEPLARTLARRKDWGQESFLAEAASKARLGRLLGVDETPALLFTATHGLGFPYLHHRQRSKQGALVCQDWGGPGGGPPSPDRYFAASDLQGEADVRGLVIFNLACYSGGTPERSYFKDESGQQARLSDFPFVSRLTQRLLGHPNGGALAVFAHIDQAWTHSFSMLRGPIGEIEVYESTLAPLLDGHRVGFAMEAMNQRFAELSVALSDLLVNKESLRSGAKRNLEFIYQAANDARSFVLLGDPAVRLAVGD